jgi:hypothetical protein
MLPPSTEKERGRVLEEVPSAGAEQRTDGDVPARMLANRQGIVAEERPGIAA